ncbi:hypothetical protein BDZ97DRAFT_1767419 [Flammula alnicola]|nr:hypothetical protein BDZ97DRAFT_1767419 [Flammula alnicola]
MITHPHIQQSSDPSHGLFTLKNHGRGGAINCPYWLIPERRRRNHGGSHEVVRVVLKKRISRLEDSAYSSRFFLDDLDRIAREDYEPFDDDVIRARLRTFVGGDAGRDWLFYIIGGYWTMRSRASIDAGTVVKYLREKF